VDFGLGFFCGGLGIVTPKNRASMEATMKRSMLSW
jgi:hypothetical protein